MSCKLTSGGFYAINDLGIEGPGSITEVMIKCAEFFSGIGGMVFIWVSFAGLQFDFGLALRLERIRG